MLDNSNGLFGKQVSPMTSQPQPMQLRYPQMVGSPGTMEPYKINSFSQPAPTPTPEEPVETPETPATPVDPMEELYAKWPQLRQLNQNWFNQQRSPYGTLAPGQYPGYNYGNRQIG